MIGYGFGGVRAPEAETPPARPWSLNLHSFPALRDAQPATQGSQPAV